MAFTFGAKSQINISTANPVVLSHTTIANTKLLVVGIATRLTTTRTEGAPTYNGVTMTQVGSTQVGAAECTAELWYLSNPSIGTYDVSVPNSGATIVTVIASSYVDAGVTGALLDQSNATNVSATNPSLSITTGFDGEAVVDIFGSGLNALAHTPNKTLLYQTDEGVWCSMAQYALQASAGVITFTWTCAIDDVAFIVGSFKGTSGTTQYGTVTLSGAGTLAGIGALILKGLATLTGSGLLATIGSYLHKATATLSGVGTVVVNGVGTFIGKATLTGDGLLSAIGDIIGGTIHYGSATLTGSGLLSAIGLRKGKKWRTIF